MKKSALILLALSARADDQTFYYWNATNGGNWTATANWRMADGSSRPGARCKISLDNSGSMN